MPESTTASEPGRNCLLCPRLTAFRKEWRAKEPDWFNAPVPGFGSMDGRLLIVGLAPGLRGANRTGRPFTGDYAGDLLYATMQRFGFAKGEYRQSADDGLTLIDARITNAVRCVPPENKPTPAEIRTCHRFLAATLSGMEKLEAVLCLGRIAHDAVLSALNVRKASYPFAHGAEHRIGDLRVFDSYHCSRYNTNTGRLTTEMFEDVFRAISARTGQQS